MFRSRRNLLLIFVLAVAALGQTESQIQSEPVERVGKHLNCQCGGCNDSVDCNMSGGQCHFCKPTRTKIYQMQTAGMSDDAVIAAFIKEYGQKIFRPDPNSSFWLVPYLALAAGVLIVWFVLRRMMGSRGLKPAAAGPSADNDPEFARYRDAVEKYFEDDEGKPYPHERSARSAKRSTSGQDTSKLE